MREDMKDLLVDTGRNGGGWGKATSRRARMKRADADDLPRALPTSRKRVGSKSLGDRLNPLKRYLKANCGRPWATVYAEICEFADSRTVRGYHLRQHVWNYVVPNNYAVGHARRYGPFFVDPDGLLQEEKRMSHAARRKLWRQRELANSTPRLTFDNDHYWEKHDGFWFWYETTHVTYNNSYEDLVEDPPFSGNIKIVRIELKPYTRSYTSKRQVNGKTQKELDKKWADYVAR
jgi:hypothetical protein